jgi:uncharacterized protein YcnI
MAYPCMNVPMRRSTHHPRTGLRAALHRWLAGGSLSALMCAGLIWVSLTQAASAHVVLAEPVALAGSSYRATFQVGHGCAGQPTTGLQVFLPASVRSTKPMPKAGWKLSTARAPLAQPETRHGQTIRDEVAAVSWVVSDPQQALPDDAYDEFVLRLSLPAQDGPLWFRVRQSCGDRHIDWAEVPAQGRSTQGLKSPAALLELLPAGDAAGHAH